MERAAIALAAGAATSSRRQMCLYRTMPCGCVSAAGAASVRSVRAMRHRAALRGDRVEIAELRNHAHAGLLFGDEPCRHVVGGWHAAEWTCFRKDHPGRCRRPETFKVGPRLRRELIRACVFDADVLTPCVPLDALRDRLNHLFELPVKVHGRRWTVLDTEGPRHVISVGTWSRSWIADGNCVEVAELASVLGRHVLLTVLDGRQDLLLGSPPLTGSDLGADFVEIFIHRHGGSRSFELPERALEGAVAEFVRFCYGLASLVLLGVDRRMMAWACARAEHSSTLPLKGFTAYFNRSMWRVLKYPGVLEFDLLGLPVLDAWHVARNAHERCKTIADAGGRLMRWLHRSLDESEHAPYRGHAVAPR